MHRNILKNLLLQNHLALMLEIWYIALPSGPYQVCSNEGPRVQDGLWPEGLRCEPLKYIEIY